MIAMFKSIISLKNYMPLSPFCKRLFSKILLICIILFVFAPSSFAKTFNYTPKEVLDRVDDLFRGNSNYGKMMMTVTTAHWKRKISLEFWNKGKNKALFKILSPKKEKGTATLRSGNKIWNYLPKIKRIIKLPHSMMSASWMGSHFSNDDLVKESRMADDYTSKISFIGKKAKKEIVKITCIPKTDSAVVWGQVILTIDKENMLPITVEYFDEDLNLARTMFFSNFGVLGGRTLPTKISMLPNDNSGESTVINYEKIKFNVKLKDSFFSLRSLKR